MKLRQLATDLYGDQAVAKVRRDYRWMLDQEHDQLCDNDLMGFAYALRLHGTTADILWAWNSHIRVQNVLTATPAPRKDTHGHQGSSWSRLAPR